MYPCAHGCDEKHHPRWRRSTAPPIKALSVKKSIEFSFVQLDMIGLLLPWANSCQELLKVAKKWKELWIVYQQFAKIPISCPNYEHTMESLKHLMVLWSRVILISTHTPNIERMDSDGFGIIPIYPPESVKKSILLSWHIFMAKFENLIKFQPLKPMFIWFPKFRQDPRISDLR